MTENDLTLDDDIPTKEDLTLDDRPTVSEPVAADRAKKMKQAWPEGPEEQALKVGIAGGNEPEYRMNMAKQKELQHRSVRVDLLSSLVAWKQSQGEPLTPDETTLLAEIAKSNVEDPETVTERWWGNYYVNRAASEHGDVTNIHNVGQLNFPEFTHAEYDVSSGYLAQLEQSKRIQAEMAEKFSATSFGAKAWSFAKGLVPLYNSWQLSKALPQTGYNLILPGNTMEEKIRAAFLLGPTKFYPVVKAEADKLFEIDPLTAMHFVTALTSFGYSDQMLSNVMGVADASTILGMGAKAKAIFSIPRNLRDFNRIRLANRSVIESTKNLEPWDAATVRGNPGQGAVLQAEAKLTDIVQGAYAKGDPEHVRVGVFAETPSNYNPGSIFTTAGAHLGREGAQRIFENMVDASLQFAEALSNAARTAVPRQVPEAMTSMIAAAKDAVRAKYQYLNDAVVDVITHDRDLSNTRSVGLIVGKPKEGTPATVFRKPLDESSPEYRAFVANGEKPEHLSDEYRAFVGPVEHEYEYKPDLKTHVFMGRTDAQPFENLQELHTWAQDIYKLDHNGYSTYEQGGKLWIDISHPIREDVASGRDLLINTKSKTPVSLANVFFGGARSAEDTLSEFLRENRHLATGAVQELRRVLQQTMAPFEALGKKQRAEITKVLTVQRDAPNPYGDPVKRGYYSKTQGDFETDFYKANGRDPTEAQSLAYWRYVQLSDFDYLLRNLNAYGVKRRQGRELVSFLTKNGGEEVTVPHFEAVTVTMNEIFKRGEITGIYKVRNGESEFFHLHDLSVQGRQSLNEEIKHHGMKVLQVAEPEFRPLAESTGHKDAIHVVLTDNSTTRKLEWKQLDYNPGPHSIYPMEHFVKQPLIFRGAKGLLHYIGDQTVHNVATEREAAQLAKHYETARQLMNAGKEAELANHLASTLPYTANEFKQKFAQGVFDKDQPFVNTLSGRRTIEHMGVTDLEKHYGEKVYDHQRSSYNLNSSLDKTFMADRDAILPSVRQTMKDGKPVFSFQPSDQIEPFSAIDRALGNATKNFWFNDLKVSSVESWVQEFADVMKVGRDELRRNPYYFFHHPQFNENAANQQQLAAAKLARINTLNFIGVKDELGRKFDWLERKAMNMVYDALGQKASTWVASHLPSGNDPYQYLRAMAFHEKLGLFNPVQLFVQAQSLSHVLAIAPRDGLHGMAAAVSIRRLMAHGWPSGENGEKLIQHLAERTPGWKTEDFREMWEAFKVSGVGNVAGDTAYKDILNPRMIRTPAGKFLDAGAIPFTEGERIVRLSAFATAYREWKRENVGKELGDLAGTGIMNRWDTLNVNMTRASMAAWQKGILSIPTQFLTFNARMAEQLLPGLMKPVIEGVGKAFGKDITIHSRLTPGEAYRAMAVYSMMYGIPVAVGGAGASFVWPIYDSVKQYAMENGIEVHQNWQQLLMEGIPSVMLSVATGRDYNFAKRMGIESSSFIHDAFTGKKSFAEIIGGASYSVLRDNVKASLPMFQALGSYIFDEGESFPPVMEDMIDATQSISTANLAMKMWMVFNYGKYISKKDVFISDVKPIDGLFMAVGLTPQSIADMNLGYESLKNQEQWQKDLSKDIIKEIVRAYTEFDNGNVSAGQAHLARAKHWMIGGDFQDKQKAAIFQQATAGRYPGLLEKFKYEWFSKAPQSQMEGRHRLMYGDK